MNNYLKILCLFGAMIFALLSCKKSGDEPSPGPKPVPMEHGTATGAPVTKTIGAAGGTISTPDGNIKIEIPAGAVTGETNFTIQPVTSTLPSATGTTYRLTPENVDFKKDIKISMQYTDEDLVGANENDLYLAYQDAAGYWRRAVLTWIDKTTKTLTINTRHFSDWTIERIFYIKNVDNKTRLFAKEETGLIAYVDDVKDSTDIIYHDIVPTENVEGWFVTGPGTFNNPKTSTTYYTAPDVIQEPKEVAVGIRIKGMVDKRHPDRPGTGGLVIVQIALKLVPDEFFIWQMDGVEHFATAVDAALLGTSTVLMGTGPTGQVGITVNTSKAGTFEAGGPAEPDKYSMQVSVPQSTVVYQSTYYNCNDTKPRYGAGKLNISLYQNVDGFISGDFNVTVYTRGEGCQNKSKQVTGSFKLRRNV
ncbi:hypothetical protein SAMN05660909_00075 [Chitinophaga terrae (ex Kim and Jung 2007)]|uniref:ZU5 domain-containing protein n=1 Tax=Chitinophaga terrae (ex Kim and Jung 2007) TaxID=408074 RepID=A0A1H3WTY0_9BACT|nr:hypothetical protein [Chitinophaga terrae (ex Kim and Jung 2007)]GEP90314.1 hypothetical protein CTE07_19590 [Chitinophaga terrae (ex Kim and Jung 2007)]SDZ90589.1 hypothetical protein SAMN05660909_00075 [Chitinophaga terrae (ex Kim and Jung 2007)]